MSSTSSDISLVFVGNIDHSVTAEMIKDFFQSGGITVVDETSAVDVKIGFAFVKCKNDNSLSDNVANLHRKPMPGAKDDRPITVEFTKSSYDEVTKRQERRKKASGAPSDTLFVVGYDPARMKPHYLEYEFESVARVLSVEMHKSFAYVHFQSISDAKAVQEKFDGKEIFGRKLTVEFSSKTMIRRNESGSSREHEYRDGYSRRRGDSREREMSIPLYIDPRRPEVVRERIIRVPVREYDYDRPLRR